MASADSIPSLKVLLIGSSKVGKSALLVRYCEDHFDPESANATIGIDVKMKKLSVRGTPYRLMIHDTERFRTLSTSYYRGAHGVILVYDLSNRSSFAAMDKWFEEVEANTMPEVAMYLVGSKLDKAGSSRAVSVEEGMDLAEAHGAKFCEVSAKTGENVRKPFVEIVDSMVQNPDLLAASSRQRSGGVTLNSRDTSSCSC